MVEFTRICVVPQIRVDALGFVRKPWLVLRYSILVSAIMRSCVTKIQTILLLKYYSAALSVIKRQPKCWDERLADAFWLASSYGAIINLASGLRSMSSL